MNVEDVHQNSPAEISVRRQPRRSRFFHVTCDTSSELHLAEQGYESMALADLLGVPADKVNHDRLYRTLDRILPHKDALEKHLKQRLGELFQIEYDLLLYDVTSTYF